MARLVSPLGIVNLQRRPLSRRPRSRRPLSARVDLQPVSRLPWESRFALSIGSIAATAGLHFLFAGALSKTPFLVYVPAVMLSGVYGGFLPAVLAAALGAAATLAIALPQPFWSHADPAGLLDSLLVFAASGLAIGLMADVLHRVIGTLRGDELGYRCAIESVTDYAIFLLDPSGRVTSWNAGAERIKGYRREEVIGRHFSIFFSPEQVAAGQPERELEQARTTGRSGDEGWRPRKDGMLYYGSAVNTAIQNENHELIGFARITRDFTERVRSEEALRERLLQASEEKYRSLFEAMDEGFARIEVIVDADGKPVDYRFIECNPAFVRQSGLADAVGKRALDLMPGLEPHWVATYGRVALTGKPERFVHWAGPLGRWFDVYAWRRGEPKDREVAILFSDITDRRRSEQALKESHEAMSRSEDRLKHAVGEATERLRKTVVELESFSYTVSHDLRAPLRAIQGFSYFVLKRSRERLDAESVKLLERITAAAARMDRLIQDLLVYGRLSRADYAMYPLDVDQVVAHVVERYLGSEKRSIAVAPNLGRVIGQDSLLTQSLSHLVDNAFKFASPERELSVSIRSERRPGGLLRLTVEDNGLGIPPEFVPKLFLPFHRLAPGEGEGTGIGLAIVKRAAERMGGSVGVETEPGRGSRFWLDLPEAS
jgi:PAS domain S-box-containing protein